MKTSAAVKRREPFSKYFIRNYQLYILLVPAMLYLFIFKYIPMLGIVLTFTDINIINIWESQWIGLENFKILFSSNEFYNIFKNSVMLSLYSIVAGFPMPIILALLINEINMARYKKISQTIMYLPHFISWVVITGLVMNFASPTNGILNQIRAIFGGESIAFLQEAKYFRTIIVAAQIWKEAGWGTIVYLAAISGINSEIYEAAVMDGANRFQKICYITLPSLMGTVVVMLILRTGSILSNGFEQVFLLSNRLNYSVSQVFETYTYEIGLRNGRFSYASAVGMFQSVVGLMLITATNAIARRVGEGSIW